jgi:hypothetical protein
MDNADVASWNTGIVISMSVSSVLGSDQDSLKCKPNQILKN